MFSNLGRFAIISVCRLIDLSCSFRRVPVRKTVRPMCKL